MGIVHMKPVHCDTSEYIWMQLSCGYVHGIPAVDHVFHNITGMLHQTRRGQIVNVPFQVHTLLTEDQMLSVRNLISPPVHSVIVETSEAIVHRHQELVSPHALKGSHDVVCSHVAYAVQDMLHSITWKMLDHPPHSLDLSLCDFHMFGSL
jgi:hypothetical protein